MNTSALKSFAPAVRRDLIEAVGRKLDVVLAAQTPDYRTTFAPQVAALRDLERTDRTGLVEKVAYTWFNRLTALRYLDARGWHPFRARVLTSAEAESTQPELLKLARDGALPDELKRYTDAVRIDSLLDGKLPSPNPQGEVYRHLILASCRFYHALLPDVFERLDDATELLLPDDLLTEQSVVQGFRTEITDDDCADVEIIGWLYQFYISERKDQVMARKSAVPAEDIPAVTQLFTPHWIVRYLVENSLGRLWLLNRPASRLREHMPYYVEGDPETDFLKITKPEEIRVCDPAVGSGHMLTYAFDLLTLIYEEEGYASADIPALILRHNLVGIEIDARAAQLAELALVFKAREKHVRFFQSGLLVRPNILELRDVRFTENELREYVRALDLGGLFNAPLIELLHQFEDAKNFGSLIQPCVDEQAIADVRRAIEEKDLGGQLFLSETHLKVLRVLQQAEALSQQYDCVVLNPPYLNRLNGPLKIFVSKYFEDYKSDLFAAFAIRATSLAKKRGLVGLVTPNVWMYIKTHYALRNTILTRSSLISLVELPLTGFSGATVQLCAYVFENGKPGRRQKGTFIRLVDFKRESELPTKTLEAVRNPDCKWIYRASAEDFTKIPGNPIAYWLGAVARDSFQRFGDLSTQGEARLGMATGNNETYLRLWQEVSFYRIGLGFESRKAAAESDQSVWFPYNKGGAFRRWYGNNEHVVKWQNDGHELRTTMHPDGTRIWAHNFNLQYIFRPCLTFTATSSSYFGIRYSPAGFLFDNKGSSYFSEPQKLKPILGFLSSAVASYLLEAINPTVEFQPGNIAVLPFDETIDAARTTRTVDQLIALSRTDWDNFETSWDFRDQPLLRPGLKGATLEASWRNWETQSTAAIRRMQELETENNRLFIAAYGLDGELQPEVPEAQITLARAEARRDMAAFLSYAVGCMMGRYSPDHPGLILANTSDSLREYLGKVGKQLAELTFVPDEDGIIPVLDGEWFEDDIVARARDFLRATFGESTLRENLRFIEDSLGKDLRKYFLTDFYKDHLQTYKKRPIYWMVQSPKKGFGALVYLHRYTRDTLNVVLNRYLREYTVRLRSRQAQLAQSLAGDSLSAAERTSARKESERIVKVLHECEEWERESLLPLAQRRVELDLDDGVKANYLKLADVLAPIPGLAAAEE